jgi:hypothetical protein
MGEMMIEMADYSHEHDEFLRADAVKIATHLHKYAPKLEEVLRDAQTIYEFIIAERAERTERGSAEVIPIGIVPKDGGDDFGGGADDDYGGLMVTDDGP